MGKALKPILIGAVIIGVGFATGGIGFAVAPSAVGLAAGAATGLTVTTLGGIALTAGLASIASGAMSALQKTPKAALGQIDRLNASIDPRAPRKMVIGQTAMATDIRYVEPSGEDQEYIDYIIAVAAHRVESIDELWIENELAWHAAGGVVGKYSGYLTINVRLEGTAGNTIAINGGANWGATRRLTGCAYLHARIKRTGNSKKAESPLVGGMPSRLTIIGKGMRFYDPRFDSSVGGDGEMRADNQDSWAFQTGDVVHGENLPLAVLNRLLGWKIAGKLSVGSGVPAERIDMASFMAAANLADEDVNRSAGGTEPRYHGACVVTENDDPGQVLSVLLSGCNGKLRDGRGKLGIWIAHNDLAGAAADDGLNDHDVLGKFDWDFAPALTECYNIVRGQYTDPSTNSLYQMVDYPEIALAEGSPDGIDRVLPLNLIAVESPSQAQRIGKQVLQRRQYQGRFSALFGERMAQYSIGDIIPLTFSGLAFDRKLFRLEQCQYSYDGTYAAVLIEENASLYAWDADDQAPVHAAAPITYDPANAPWIRALYDGSVTFAGGIDTIESLKPAEIGATRGAPAGTPVGDREAELIVADLERNGYSLINTILRGAVMKNYVDALTMLRGLPIGTVLENFQEQTIEGLNAIVQTLALIGAKSGDGEAWIIDLNSVKVDPDQSLGQKLDGISSSLNGNAATISFLLQALTSVNSAEAKAVIQLDVNGNISGISLTNDGSNSAFNVVASQFSFVDDSGAIATRPLYYDNNILYLDNVYIKKLAPGSIDFEFEGLKQLLDPVAGYQVLPGGFIIQWGQYRAAINGEVSIDIEFPMPFPNALMSAQATPFINTSSYLKDLWIQSTSARDRFGAQFYTQAATGDDMHLDGFDWIAFGK